MKPIPKGAFVHLRPMTMADLEQVNAIEQVSFSTPWPEQAFAYELTRNPNALCWVADWTHGEQPASVVGDIIIWLILDEAHIGTLAVAPDYRGWGIAQRLLAQGLLASSEMGATHGFLEVRVSNQAAIQLYHKFGFEEVGLRRGYYQDTREDAVLMTLANLNPEKLAELAQGG